MTPDETKPNDEILSAEDQEFERAMREDFSSFLPNHMQAPVETFGEVIEVAVVDVRDNKVFIDVGGKSELSIPIDEFPLVGTERAVKAGDKIKVIQLGRGDEANPRYSFREARKREAQETIRIAQESKQPIKGRVISVVKGGVMVDVGLDAFMPASQVDLFKVPSLEQLVGQEIEAYVLEFDARRNRAVLSRRTLLFERRENQRRSFLETLEPGTTVRGKVKSALEFGVFVDLGMVDGFIPREEVSWDRGRAPEDVLKPGDEVDVRIMSVAKDNGRITLSRKRLGDNPWEGIEQRFPVGSIVRGKVITMQSYGAFVHIEEGITGMIHATDMSWSSGNKKPGDYVKVGDEVTSIVLEVNKDKRRLSLGLKQLQRDPWADVAERYAVNTRHKGTVSSLTNYGAFVRLDDYVEGMVHVSDISWEKRVNHPKDHLKVGDVVDVVVLKLDNENRRISLGIKQLQDSPYDAYLKAHPVGTVVKGKVSRFAPFGAFVELASGLEGLIHISHIDDKRVELPEKALQLGQEITVKIIGAEKKNQKISLSRREAMRAAEKENIKAYMSKKGEVSGGMNFGEALRAAKEKGDE